MSLPGVPNVPKMGTLDAKRRPNALNVPEFGTLATLERKRKPQKADLSNVGISIGNIYEV